MTYPIQRFPYVLIAVLIGASLVYLQAAMNKSGHIAAGAQTKAQISTRAQRRNSPPTTPRLSSATKLKLMSIGTIRLKKISETVPLPATFSKGKVAKDRLKPGTTPSTADLGISEFQTVSNGFGVSSGGLAVPSSRSKGSILKSIHGELDGEVAPGRFGANQVDGAAGGTSKSGKTSIFLQASHTTVQEPRQGP
jgi:hypothetical protein